MVAFVSEAALVSSQSQGLPEASSAEFPQGNSARLAASLGVRP